MKHKNAVSRFRQWLARHDEWEHRLFVVFIGAGLFLLALIFFWNLDVYPGVKPDGQMVFLSASVAVPLGVLAILYAVGSGLGGKPLGFWLYSSAAVCLPAIAWPLAVLAGWVPAGSQGERKNVAITSVLLFVALAHIIPVTLAGLRSRKSTRPRPWAGGMSDYSSLLDNQESMSVVEVIVKYTVKTSEWTLASPTRGEALDLLAAAAREDIQRSGGAVEGATQAVKPLMVIGREAYQRRDSGTVLRVVGQLCDLTAYCNAPPRFWREAADVFNDAVKELYSYVAEWTGRDQP